MLELMFDVLLPTPAAMVHADRQMMGSVLLLSDAGDVGQHQ
jgi:hypothetical protein